MVCYLCTLEIPVISWHIIEFFFLFKELQPMPNWTQFYFSHFSNPTLSVLLHYRYNIQITSFMCDVLSSSLGWRLTKYLYDLKKNGIIMEKETNESCKYPHVFGTAYWLWTWPYN